MNNARSKRSSWKWMILLASITAIAIISSAFFLALLWSVDYIARVEPLAADYGSSSYYSVLPLDPQIVQVARVDRGELVFNDDDIPPATPIPTDESSTATNTAIPVGATATSIPSATAGGEDTPEPTLIESPSPTITSTPTPTITFPATLVSSSTPRPTNPRPTHSNPTNTQPAMTATTRPTRLPTQTQPPPTQPPPPTSTSAPPPTAPPPTSPPPTQPPPPTRTRDPYPPPTAYP